MRSKPSSYRFDTDAFRYAAARAGYSKAGRLRCALIAEDSGVNERIVRRYAEGLVKNPMALHLAALAATFGCTVDDFIEEMAK